MMGRRENRCQRNPFGESQTKDPCDSTMRTKKPHHFEATQSKACSLSRNTRTWFSQVVPFGVVTEVTHPKTTFWENSPEQPG